MAAAKKTTGRKRKDTRSDTDKLVDAALELAATKRWKDISVPEIAAHARVPLGRTLMNLHSRNHIVRALIDRVDAHVLSSLKDDPLDGNTKDKLFDLLMRRFDALTGHQAAIATIASSVMCDPLSAACLGNRFLKSMAVTLQAAGVSTSGCTGAIKVKALAAIQLNAARAWIKDEDEGLAKTMSALDKGLRRAEQFAAGRSPADID